jgi:hypothetical protein
MFSCLAVSAGQRQAVVKSAFAALAMTALLLAGCSRGGDTPAGLPTPVDPQQVATSQFMTQGAPPEGFRGPLSLPRIDANLDALPGWHYTVELEFDGTFAGTPRPTSATAIAEVWFNQLGTARRVIVTTAGELIGKREDDRFEAVRLGPDAFLVRNNVCLTEGADPQTAADLDAGRLVGGVTRAFASGHRATVNNEAVWRYDFAPTDLTLPAIRLQENGSITLSGSELWFAPDRNAVIRFYLTFNVENAIIFDRQLPVSGQVIVRYDLLEIGTVPNITVPFGC